MTSKERFRIAMQGGTPDRVPVMCQLAVGHYFLYSGIDPLEIWYTSEGFSEALIKMQQQYDFDGILVNLSGRQPNWRDKIDKIEEKPDGEKWIYWKNGNFTKFPKDDNPHYYMGDGSRYFPTFDEIDPEKLYYIDPWNLTEISYPFTWDFEEFERPRENFFPPYIHDTLKKVIEKVGDEISVHAEIFSPFSQFLELLNYENALMALLDDPDKSHACLKNLTKGAIELGISAAKEGADAILISSAFAGSGFISRDNYEEFVLPYEKELISAIKAEIDIPVFTHTCGGIGDRLDLMMESGLNGIDTLDPPPLGTVELEEAMLETRGKIFIKGNIDAVNTLLLGNEETVQSAVKNRLHVAKDGGGYICSTACSIAPSTKPSMIEHMVKITHKFGKY
ncbi:MAG: uroporphyrinogen decarboxylase family protein [Bacteroidota bacterium]